MRVLAVTVNGYVPPASAVVVLMVRIELILTTPEPVTGFCEKETRDAPTGSPEILRSTVQEVALPLKPTVTVKVALLPAET